MEIFIELNKDCYSFKQEQIESAEIFTKRLKFFLYAIDSGFITGKAKILANCYMNKLLYDCIYSDIIEDDIIKVTNQWLIKQ